MIAWYFKSVFLDAKDDVVECEICNPFKGEYIMYFLEIVQVF